MRARNNIVLNGVTYARGNQEIEVIKKDSKHTTFKSYETEIVDGKPKRVDLLFKVGNDIVDNLFV